MKGQRPFLFQTRHSQVLSRKRPKTAVFWVKKRVFWSFVGQNACNKQTNKQTIQNKRNKQQINITLYDGPEALSLPSKTLTGPVQKEAKTLFFGLKMSFFGHLGLKMASKHP